MIETGLCGHSRPTADICATMFQQLGVPLNLNESMPEPLMVGSRLCRDYLYHDDLAEKREVYCSGPMKFEQFRPLAIEAMPKHS